ncbi:MAG: 50S ribosomal protein L11 methyltransferase [Oscillospiraceae bacterium]|nr:50S ribosomal protein L11 methyltransferase [Oscillospiraceae bacterium]
MQWLECTVECGRDTEEVCQRLAELGVEGMSVENEEDFRSFLENNHAYWDYVDEELERRFAGVSRVKFWLADDEDGRAVLDRVRKAGFAPAVGVIADEDWENNWKQYYVPIPIGEKLVVVPAWEDAPADGRLPLRLDPGLIFGTGSHATTRMCLEALEGLSGPEKRVLDLGCGSGILSIGALVLGCASAAGCDIDPKAPEVAMDNAALNGIGPSRFRVYAGDILTDRGMRKLLGTGYEIVLANIVSDVIIPLAPIAREFLAPGGDFVCSGIIEGRQAEVAAALREAGFAVVEHQCQEEWHCFRCRAE